MASKNWGSILGSILAPLFGSSHLVAAVSAGFGALRELPTNPRGWTLGPGDHLRDTLHVYMQRCNIHI